LQFLIFEAYTLSQTTFNAIISTLHGLIPKEISSIRLPIVQEIMSVNCQIKMFTFYRIFTPSNYSKTIKEINEDAIDDIMAGFLLIDVSW